MPIIPKTELPFPDNFASNILDSSVSKAGSLVPQVGMVGWSEIGQASINNGMELAARLAQNVASNLGLPDATFKGLEDLYSFIVAIAGGEDLTPLEAARLIVDSAGTIIPLVLEAIEQVTETVVLGGVSVVPILGWLVRIGLLIRDIVKIATSKEAPDADYPALTFATSVDTERAQLVLNVLRTNDWTDVYRPPNNEWNVVTLAYGTKGSKVDGFAWGPGVTKLSSRLGAQPGYTDFGTYFQSPMKTIGSTRTAGALDITSWGNVAVSANQTAAMAWAFMGQETGRCGTVDFAKVQNAWGEWQETGHDFLKYIGKDLNTSNAAWIIQQLKYTLGEGGPYPGKMPTIKRIDMVGNELAKARFRFHRLLATRAVAYTPGNSPALNDPALKERWTDMRKLLLKHPDRYNVDLDMVAASDKIDGGTYAADLFQSRLAAPLPVGTDGPKARRRVLDGGAEPPPAELPQIPGYHLVSHVRKNWVPYVILASVVGYYGYKRGWHERVRKWFQ
jgi:hypothetical protein